MSQQLKVKKVPMRKCVITNEQHPKMEMFRVVRTPENEVVVDLTGKVRGHGAYVCKKKSAIQTAMKKKTLDRHLEVVVPDSVYQEMLNLLEQEVNK